MTENPRPPIGEGITFLFTGDYAASIHFYQGVLGLRLVLDQGTCRIYQLAGSAYLGLCDRPAEGEHALILTIVTPEVDAWYDRLRAAGVRCDHAPRHNPAYGIYHFFARDPAGYRVEFQRFDDPDWLRVQRP
jgi:catechol 2,3-dioxygenase-like lactoylglutathione lyase family enzyme